jgi:hypothetical protein
MNAGRRTVTSEVVRWGWVLVVAAALGTGTARAAGEEVHTKRSVAAELIMSAHGGLAAVIEDELNAKSPFPTFGIGLAGFLERGPFLVGAGADAVTILLQGDVLVFGAAGGRHILSPERTLTFLAQAGFHRISDCYDAALGSGCNPGARLPFLGAKVGMERTLPGQAPFGVWLSVAQDIRTEHVPEAARAPTYGGTVVLLSVSIRLGGRAAGPR